MEPNFSIFLVFKVTVNIQGLKCIT